MVGRLKASSVSAQVTEAMRIAAHLIKQEEISIVEHSPSKLKLHLPATRQAPDNLGLSAIVEANLYELVPDLGAWDPRQRFVCEGINRLQYQSLVDVTYRRQQSQ